MRFILLLMMGILLLSPEAKAWQFIIPKAYTFAGLRVSYTESLGLGFGVHASYWDVNNYWEAIDEVPIVPSATLGAVWYKGLSRQYIGLQTGLLAGVSGGIFAQQGKLGSFTGKYYEVWGAYLLGGSVRQFMKWGEGVRQTPLEWSLFGTYPVLLDGEKNWGKE
jgi:hypothetical protein